MGIVEEAGTDSVLVTALLTILIKHDCSRALEFALKVVYKFGAKRADRDIALGVGRLLLEHAPRKSWDPIWNLILDDNAFGRSLIESATHQSFGNLHLADVLTEAELGQLLSWMFQNYPVREDAFGQAGPVSSIFTAHRFRDVLLQRLIARDTPDALRVLEQIQLMMPQLPWAYYLIEAHAHLRQTSWIPPEPREFRELGRPDKRLVNNADQLIEILKEVLDRIQKKLHAESEAVIELWNYTNTKIRRYWPKDENDFSNWLKRRLEDEIVARGVIVAREVEIRRKRGILLGSVRTCMSFVDIQELMKR